MPKVFKESTKSFLSRMSELYPKDFRADESVLFCLQCEVKIKATQIFQLKQHLLTQKHIEAKQRKEKSAVKLW